MTRRGVAKQKTLEDIMRVERGREVPAQEDTTEETTVQEKTVKVEEEEVEDTEIEVSALRVTVVEGGMLAMGDEESAQGPLVMGGLL